MKNIPDVKIIIFGVNGEILLGSLKDGNKSAYMGNLENIVPCPAELLKFIPEGTLAFCKNNPPQYYYISTDLLEV